MKARLYSFRKTPTFKIRCEIKGTPERIYKVVNNVLKTVEVLLTNGVKDLKVSKRVKNESIELTWRPDGLGHETSVNLIVYPGKGSSILAIEEAGWDFADSDSIHRSQEHAAFWQGLAYKIKASLEHGVELV